MKPFISKYKWERINQPSKIGWKTFEKKNPTGALNILYIKDKEMCAVYILKLSSNCEKTNNSINDSKQRKERMTLFCSKRIIYIITWNNFET